MSRPDYKQRSILIISRLRRQIKQLKMRHENQMSYLDWVRKDDLRHIRMQLRDALFAASYWRTAYEVMPEGNKGGKAKRGPKGPRTGVLERRAAIKFLREVKRTLTEICIFLQDRKYQLPSKQLRDGYGQCAWVQWHNRDAKSVSRQVSMDLKRATRSRPQAPLPEPTEVD
jgi:hypothetical protein